MPVNINLEIKRYASAPNTFLVGNSTHFFFIKKKIKANVYDCNLNFNY